MYGFVRKYVYYACHTRVWSNKKPYNSVNRAMRAESTMASKISTVGFLGAGQIATALVRGFLAAGMDVY